MPGATIVVSLAASAFAILGALAAPHPGPSSLIASGAPLSARDQLGFRCQGANTFTLDGTHTQTCASCLVCKEGVGCAWPDDSGTCGGGASASSGEEATTIVEANETTAVASPAAESTIALKQNAVVSVVESDTGEDDCQDEVEETGATGASPTPTPTPTPTPGGTGSPTDGTAAAESTLDLQRNAVVTGTPGEGTPAVTGTPAAPAASTGATGSTGSGSYSGWHVTPLYLSSTPPGTTGACGWDLTTVPSNWVALGSDVFDLGTAGTSRNDNLQCGRKLKMKVKGTGASIDVFVADWRGDAGGFDMDFDYMSSKMAEAGGGPIASGFDVDWEFSEPMLSAPRKP